MNGAASTPSQNSPSALHGTGVFLPHPQTQSTRIERQMISSYNKIRKLCEASSTGSNEADSSTKQPNSQHPGSATASPRLHPIAVADVQISAEQALPNLTPVSSPTCAFANTSAEGRGEQFGPHLTNLAGNSAHEGSSKTNRYSDPRLGDNSSWPDSLAAPEVGGWSITRPRSSGTSTSRQPTLQQHATAAIGMYNLQSQSSRNSGGMQLEAPSSTAHPGNTQALASVPVPRPRRRSKVISTANSAHQMLRREQEWLLQQQGPDTVVGVVGSACSPVQLHETQQGMVLGVEQRDALAGSSGAGCSLLQLRDSQLTMPSTFSSVNSSSTLIPLGSQVHAQSDDSQTLMAAIDDQVMLLLQLRQQALAESVQAAKAAATAAGAPGASCNITDPQDSGSTAMMTPHFAAQSRQGNSSSTSRHQLSQANMQLTAAAVASSAPHQNSERHRQLQLMPDLTQQFSDMGLQEQLSASSLGDVPVPWDGLQLDSPQSFGSMLASRPGVMPVAVPDNRLRKHQHNLLMHGLTGNGSIAVGSAMHGSQPAELQAQQQVLLNGNSGYHIGEHNPYCSLGGSSATACAGLESASHISMDSGCMQALGEVQRWQQSSDMNIPAVGVSARNSAVAAKMRQLATVQDMQRKLQEELLQLLQ